ncbi:unnamed protein product [Chironomus riparius]|uniref:Ninjurin a n=1 Tax=Chironomus riparius TaxID=315576 RepID=A0A9P0NEX8_9DIPT|nr:unnamed protein product [Chironomus riparius]
MSIEILFMTQAVIMESAEREDVIQRIDVDQIDAAPIAILDNEARLGKRRNKSAEKAQDKYKHKKAMAQGMLDLALLSSNAHQLRLILEYKERNNYFYVSIACISLSIILQVIVAVAFILKFKVLKRYYYGEAMDEETQQKNFERKARFDNFISLGILFITIINVFMSAFGSAQT